MANVYHNITLSLTDFNNIGDLKVRQADEKTHVFDVEIIEDGKKKPFTGLKPFFCLMAREITGQGVSEEPVQNYDSSGGTLKYTLSDNAFQMVGRNEAYFSFRRETQSGNWIEQFSTRSFFYTVEKSIYTQPFKDSNYWFTFKELYKKFIDYQDSGKISWEEFVNQNKEIIESVDPGGTLLSRIGIFDSFRTADYTVIEKLQNESIERGLNILWYGAKNDASESFKESVERAIADLPDYGGDIIIPAGEYLYQFEEQSTIQNPTRIEIRKPNVRIVGIGKPRILMKGLTKEYLDSIDDFASSGRDIFSLFSFIGVDGGSVSNIEIVGENVISDSFRYESPRSIGISIKGSGNVTIEDISGSRILGNLVNVTHTYSDYDGPFRESSGVTISNSTAYGCLENAYNAMGGTRTIFGRGLNSTACANGFESAADGLFLSDCDFNGNKSSGIGLSGKNQYLNNVSANGQTSSATNNGYGLVVTSGGGVRVSNCTFNGNKAFGIYLYPGVSDVKIFNSDIKKNAKTNNYKGLLQIVGTAEKRIKDVQFINCDFEAEDTVYGAAVSNSDSVEFINCRGKFIDASYAVNFADTCTDSRAIANKFNKAVNMNDLTGESYNNGLTRMFERSTLPQIGTWNLGDTIKNIYPSIGGWEEAKFMQGGTFGTLTNVSATIVQGSKDIVFSSTVGIYVGCYILINGEPGLKRITQLNGINGKMDIAATNSVTGVCSYRAPILSVTKQAGVKNAITSPPDFVGQFATTGGSNPSAFIATGTSSVSDWKQITN